MQVCPLALQLGGARHTPPASQVVPVQQSAALFARIPLPAQVALQVGVPVAVEARQYGALPQQGVVLDRHVLPEDRQLGAARHTPEPSMLNPTQQSPWVAAFTPSGAQVVAQLVAEVADTPRQNLEVEQHALGLEQAVPEAPQVGAAWQTPLVQASWLQHWVAPPQVCPLLRQLVCTWQVPPLQVSPEQHGLVAEQLSPEVRQVEEGWQLPPVQVRPPQHTSPPAQLCPVIRQAVP